MGSNPINYPMLFFNFNFSVVSLVKTPILFDGSRYRLSFFKKRYILWGYQFIRYRIKIFSFDLVKTYVHLQNTTITPGVILAVFNYPNPRNLRKNLLTNQIFYKLFKQFILTNMYVFISPLCLRNN